MRALLLYTGDLRVHDHAALVAAARGGTQVVPAFVLDEALLAAGRCASPNRLTFLLESLAALDAQLRARGAGLVVRRGEVVEQALRLARRFGAHAIYMSAETTPYARRRSVALRAACERARIALHELPGASIVAPGALAPAGGDHYRVFTPYWRAWSRLAPGGALRAPRTIDAPPDLPALRLPALATRDPSGLRIEGGEAAARKRLAGWVARGLHDYEQLHDDLAGAATSRLSADLHFGCLSAREALARTAGRPGGEAFARQLCWRDFHRQLLAACPELPRADYRSRGDRWSRSIQARDAWREGRTGFPIVDAGMRQLASEGFMHNRARLIVASFLTKTLYLDWRIGAAHFAALLQDADVANNIGNWQWVAGTGTDTRPNRVLNPLRQARRFDPAGEYVRRHVPELAALPAGLIHEPWRLPGRERRALVYPAPIVDLRAAAAELRHRRQGSSSPA